jgi:hypothetical protein
MKKKTLDRQEILLTSIFFNAPHLCNKIIRQTKTH